MTRALLAAFALAGALGAARPALAAEELRFKIAVLPELARYESLFAVPGYAAVSLESNGLSPSLSSKLAVREGGRSVAMRYGAARFLGRKGALYQYEVAITPGAAAGGARITFPATLDASGLANGKLVVTLRPPLASLVPAGIIERVEFKLRAVAGPAAQKSMLDFLDQLAKSSARDGVPLNEAILLDAYERSAGAAGAMQADVGDALPISEQWMLILTLAIWLVGLPALWLLRRCRRRAKS